MEIHVGNNDIWIKSEEHIGVIESIQQTKDIKDGMGDLNLTGKIIEISDVRIFQHKDGTAGEVGNLLFGDSMGAIRVVLWDKKPIIKPTSSMEMLLILLTATPEKMPLATKWNCRSETRV